MYENFPKVSKNLKTKKNEKSLNFKLSLQKKTIYEIFRNSFPIYASTLGNEEASEADDVFNERAELSSFRDKLKMNSHENEVKYDILRNLSIFSLLYINCIMNKSNE